MNNDMIDERMPEAEMLKRKKRSESMTEVEVKQWLIWAAIAIAVCTLLSIILAVVSSSQNREAAAVLQVESETKMEFYLNRKGTFLGTMGDAEGIMKDHTLKEGVEKLLQGLSDHGNLSDGGAVIFTLRPYENGRRTDLQRFADEIHVYAEMFLRKRHSGGAVYVKVVEEPKEYEETMEKYGADLGKAALTESLLYENAVLGSSDFERFLKMPLDRLSKVILDEKYETDFIVVTAKQVYMKQQEEDPEEELTEMSTEAATEAATEAPTEAPTQAPTETPAPNQGMLSPAPGGNKGASIIQQVVPVAP